MISDFVVTCQLPNGQQTKVGVTARSAQAARTYARHVCVFRFGTKPTTMRTTRTTRTTHHNL